MTVTALATREFASFARTPVGWVVTALYTLFSAAIFVASTLVPGEPASLRYFFGPAGLLLLIIAPAVSMRLFSEELRSGTIEPLAAGPSGEAALVLGKFAGAVLFIAAMLTPTLAFPAVLLMMSSPTPDLGPIVAGYLGLVLVSGVYLSVGLLISTMTDSQTLAYLATLMVLLITLLLTDLAGSRLPGPLAEHLAEYSINTRLGAFAKGVIETGSIVYFAAITATMLAASVLTLGRRRWR